MTTNTRHTNFIGIFLRTLSDEYQDKGLKAFNPWVLTLCLATGVALGYFMPIVDDFAGNIAILLAAMLTAQGIVLAISLSSGQQIFASITAPGFSSFLRQHNVLDDYLICIAIMEYTGIISIVVILAAAGLFLFQVPEVYLRIAAGASLSAFLYSVRWLAGGSVMVRDLIYYRSVFDELQQQSPDSPVVPFRNHRGT